MIASLLRPVVRHVPGARRAYLTARFGDLGRTAPLTNWGSQRGLPVDRWYIQDYLYNHSADVSGRVLEVKSDLYGSRLGASVVDVVDIDPTNPRATVIGDLCDPATLDQGRYDAAIVTQTLQLVSDPEAALRNVLRSLRLRGVLLITVPCLSRLVGDIDRWRWTPAGFQQLVLQVAPVSASVEVVGLGNGLAGRAFLFGLAAEDVAPSALAVRDVDYPLIVGACVHLHD
jgi:SAM-dependent methyltransferase